MKKILVVDDEKDALLMLEKRLTAEGHSVITTTNGMNAISFSEIATP